MTFEDTIEWVKKVEKRPKTSESSTFKLLCFGFGFLIFILLVWWMFIAGSEAPEYRVGQYIDMLNDPHASIDAY